MSFIQIFLIAISLAMDAFAVAICKGLKLHKIDYKYAGTIAVFFGSFQSIMAILGWLLGINFAKYIDAIDNFVAFTLLSAIGGKMICESFETKEIKEAKYDLREIIFLSVATSIDALAVGIMFAMLDTNIYLASLVIGIIALILSFLGVIIGNLYGAKHKNKAEITGGTILVLLGIKFLFA